MLKFILSKIKKYREYRRVFNELSSLSDHELLDIGICRCDISLIASESVKGKEYDV